MNCNDCCRPIESCVCSLFGGKTTERKLRALSGRQSGFEPKQAHKTCRHPQHSPPTHLHIPADQIYRHVCPACGHTVRIAGSDISM